MRMLFVSWAPYCSRSDNIARCLGGESVMVYESALGSRLSTIWLKYFRQARTTGRLLAERQPEAVFVMAPPPVAALAVLPYCRRRRVPFVIDAHTAAFLHGRWKRLQWLQGYVSRRAATTIVTNDHLAGLVRARGGHASIITDVPVEFGRVDPYPRGPEFTVAVVCSFNADEPVGEIIEAARRLPGVKFLVTGNPAKLAKDLEATLPANMALTGFLPDAAYGGLLQGANAVLTLTTRNHTMLRGAYEAVYQGTPVVVSDWPLLRQAFAGGAVFVQPHADDIARGVGQLMAGYESARSETARLRQRKLGDWERAKATLVARLAEWSPRA